MHFPYFIKEHLWMECFWWCNNKKKKKKIGGSKPSSKLKVDLKNKILPQVVAAVMILELVNNWRSALQIIIKKS